MRCVFLGSNDYIDDTEVLDPRAAYERSQYVRLTIFIPEADKYHADPKIYVEQQVYRGSQKKILIHELLLGEVKLGVDYVFLGCGDEDINGTKRALRLQIQSVGITVEPFIKQK